MYELNFWVDFFHFLPKNGRMYLRTIPYRNYSSFFLFGARGVGKSQWVRQEFGDAVIIDLLSSKIFNELQANPSRLSTYLPAQNCKSWVIIDEIQKIPKLLDEVHKLIEDKKIKFILTGSSARKLKSGKTNLLAGRALLEKMYPLTTREIGSDFNFSKSVRFGHLPKAYTNPDPESFLHTYVKMHLKEEVRDEGFTRNIDGFARFLEAASFSHGQYLNISAVAADCHVERKTVTEYFNILEDMMLAYRLPIFTKRAKRTMATHQKFFFFDSGIYQTLRPRGPLDSPEEIDGPAWEGLVLQELMAENYYHNWKFEFYAWHVSKGSDVDFVLYGPKGIFAFEVKRSSRIRGGELDGLKSFLKDYPMAKAFFISGSQEVRLIDGIQTVNIEDFLKNITSYF
jgi:predicted AAA+ superfamily ATPase